MSDGLVRVLGCNYDGSPHWEHPARLVEHAAGIVVTATAAGQEVQTERGPWTSPFHTLGVYWPDRWFNVIRLEEPGYGLNGWYCNVASPVEFDGATLRYVDLQIDVRVFVREGALVYEVWDEDEFEAARARYAYPEDLVARCRRAVEEIIALIESRAYPFDDDAVTGNE